MNKLRFQKIDWLENSWSLNELSVWYVEVIKLEQVKKSSSQRSQVRTSEVEIRAFKHVAVLSFSWATTWESSPCVCVLTLFPGNRALDFAETWSEVTGGWMGNGDTARFPGKNLAH